MMKLIHAKTESEAKRICKMFHKMGLTWSDGTSYLLNTEWHHYKRNTVYCDNGKFYNLEWCFKNKVTTVNSQQIVFKPTFFQRFKYFIKRVKNNLK